MGPSDFIMPQRTEQRELTTAYKLLSLGRDQCLSHDIKGQDWSCGAEVGGL